MENMIPITITRNGDWYYGNNKMFRLNIVSLLARHLEKDNSNNYYIKCQEQIHPVTVEETPFFAQRVIRVAAESLTLQLTDGRTVTVPADTVELHQGIPYATLKWPLDTKFSRQALWDLSDYLEEKNNGQVQLKIAGKTYPITSL